MLSVLSVLPRLSRSLLGRLVLLGSFVCAMPVAFADGGVPVLGAVRLIVANGPFDFNTIDLSEIPTRDCTSSFSSQLDIFKCGVADGSTFVVRSAAGEVMTVPIERMVYFATSRGDVGHHELIYVGKWTRTVNGVTLVSSATLSVHYDDSAPERLYGYVSLKDLDFTRQLQGVRL